MREKSQSSKKMRSLLERSRDQGLILRISRSVEPDETLDGVVLNLGRDWALLASIRDGGYLDGYRVLKLKHFRRVELEPTFEAFLKHDAQWPPAKPIQAIDLEEPRSLVESAAKASTPIAVFREVKRPGRCFIGAPVDWNRKSFWLLTIDTDGAWESYMTKIKFKDLTQISFGGDYEKALLFVAGTLPPRRRSSKSLGTAST